MKASGWKPGDSQPAIDGIEADYTIESISIPLAKPLEWAARPLVALIRAQWLARFAGNEVAKTGIKTANGIEITGFAKHGLDRTIERGVKPNAILDAMKNPLKTGNVVIDQLGRQSQRFIGQFGEVVVNPLTGKIISVNPTSSSKAAKLLKELEK